MSSESIAVAAKGDPSGSTRSATSRPHVHGLTVDVEDWYHDSQVGPGPVGHRVEANTDRLLELFDQMQVRATFFFLGEVAERNPALVRRVRVAGHEIGSHGYCHRKVGELTRQEFRDDVTRSLQAI